MPPAPFAPAPAPDASRRIQPSASQPASGLSAAPIPPTAIVAPVATTSPTPESNATHADAASAANAILVAFLAAPA